MSADCSVVVQSGSLALPDDCKSSGYVALVIHTNCFTIIISK